MRKADVQETLAALYLRLNGYFTTGLIVHSPTWGQSRTEIDCLAVRLPYHSQAERGLDTAKFLDTAEGTTDLVLCEVKGDPTQLRFNASITEDREAVPAILRWSGVFHESQIGAVADRFRPFLADNVPVETARAGLMEGAFRVRALLCCPVSSTPMNDRWILTGDEIFGHVSSCLAPTEKRSSCSTRYNFAQWGHPFASVVRCFKEASSPTLDDLYDYLGAQ